jgi:ABC-type uncharacterized transport system permease subunit
MVAINFWWFYGPASGFWLIPSWIIVIFFAFVVNSIVSALGAELFPTSYRSVASGIRLMSALLFGSLGLVAQGALFNYFGNHAEAVLALLIFVPLAIIPALFLPETARRDLDDISPEKSNRTG